VKNGKYDFEHPLRKIMHTPPGVQRKYMILELAFFGHYATSTLKSEKRL